MSKKNQDSFPFLEFENVSVVRRENKKILDTVTLNIQEGENIAILGPNGAGKSSLIKLITREYYPFPGSETFRLKIFGQERWNVFDLRSLLGIVSDDLQQTCTLEILGLELILSGFFSTIGLYEKHLTNSMKKKAGEVAEFLEISHLCQVPVNQMSMGEIRRFLIARALVHDPKMLILDEPSNSLDFYARHVFFEMIRKICRHGTGIILVTHHLQDIIPEISRVVLFQKGKIFRDGLKEKILTNKIMTQLFNIPVKIHKYKDYYYAM